MICATSVSPVSPSAFDWDASSGAASEVRRVTAAASAADGRNPLNEATLLSLRHHGLESSALFLAEITTGTAPASTGAGFALVTWGAPGQPAELNLVVDPAARGNGVAGALAAAVLDKVDGPVSAWSHGNHPAAAALAASCGFERVRDLWVMRRSLREELPSLRDAGHFAVRPFEPGRDEDAFLAVNAAAFAHHPEQGTMTRDDLEQREAEPWFDPAGFFLAVSADPTTGRGPTAGQLLGFHWTKVHAGDPAGIPALGEVYVVGVSPDAQGMGLGTALTLTGLHHLRDQGLDEVILYVEADNAPAVAVYEGLGFTHADQDTDVRYSRRR